jgi:hypothetical protein
LIRDAEGDGGMTLVRERSGQLAQDRNREIGDFGGVVFDPPGGGVELGQFAVRLIDHPAGVVKCDRTDTRGAGVKGEDHFHSAHPRRGIWGKFWVAVDLRKGVKKVPFQIVDSL